MWRKKLGLKQHLQSPRRKTLPNQQAFERSSNRQSWNATVNRETRRLHLVQKPIDIWLEQIGT
jgi:hypothetical protein